MAIQDKVESTLNAPRLDFGPMVPSVTSYAVLKEELQMRSMQNSALRQEQTIAFADGARRKMHQQAVENDENSVQARNAVAQIPGMLERGMSFAQIKSEQMKQDPMRAFNPAYMEAMKPFEAYAEDEHTTFMRQNAETLKEQNIEMLVRKGEIDQENLPLIMQSYDLGIKNASSAEEAREWEFKKARATRAVESKVMEDSFSTLMKAQSAQGITPGATPQAIDALDDYLALNNQPVGDMPTFINSSRVNDADMRFLIDPGSVQEAALRSKRFGTDPATAAEGFYAATQGVLSDKTIGDAALAGDADAIAKQDEARALLRTGRGIIRRRFGDKIEEAARLDTFAKIDQKIADGYQNVSDDIATILAKTTTTKSKGSNGMEVTKTGTSQTTLSLAQNRMAAFVNGTSLNRGEPIQETELSWDEMKAKVSKELTWTDNLERKTIPELTQWGIENGLWAEGVPSTMGSNGQLKKPVEFGHELRQWAERRIVRSENPTTITEPQEVPSNAVVPKSTGGTGAVTGSVGSLLQERIKQPLGSTPTN